MFGKVLGAISGDHKVEANVDINVGSIMESSSSSSTTTTTNSFGSRITGQMDFLKSETERYKKENDSLKSQLSKHVTIINSQAKQIGDLKQEKAHMIQKSMTITSSTTTSSTEEKAKIAEQQSVIQGWIEENARDDAKIAEQDLQIGHLKVRIDTLEEQLRFSTIQYEGRIKTITEENKRLNDRMSESQNNDIDDATKISNLHKAMDKLREELAAHDNMLKQYEENANHFRIDLETKCADYITIEKEKDSLTFKLDTSKKNVEDKELEIADLNSKIKELEERIVTLEVTVAQKEKRFNDAEAKVISLNEKIKTANANSEKFIEKAKRAETDLTTVTFKITGLERTLVEQKKLADMMKSKADNADLKVSTFEKKIIELQDLIKKREAELKEIKAQDVNEDKELEFYKKLAAQKEEEANKLKVEDVDDKTLHKSQTQQIHILTEQTRRLTDMIEKMKVTIANYEVVIANFKNKFILLKKLFTDLKDEMENAHGLSAKFEIKKESTTSYSESEKTKDKVETSAEYKSLQLDIQQHTHELESERVAHLTAIASIEAMSKELAQARGELELIKRQYQTVSVQLDQEKSLAVKYFEEKRTFTFSQTKEVEKERSYFQSAVESVTTYKDDINRLYGTISISFANIENELI